MLLVYAATDVKFRMISQLPDSKGKEKAKEPSASPTAASYVPFICLGNITCVYFLDRLHYLRRLLKMKCNLMISFLTLMNCTLSFVTYGFFSLYYYMILYSAGALPLEEAADANKAEMKAEDGENDEHGKDDSGANHLSVMYPPCQDPLLFKMYRGLPALPYVFLSV